MSNINLSDSADTEVASSEPPSKKDIEIGETAGVSTEVKPEVGSTDSVAISAPADDSEDRSVVVTEAITKPQSAN